MKLPFELVVREATLPAALRSEMADHAQRLEHFCDRISRCRVTVTGPGRHAHGRWSLKIGLTVPGRELVITRQGGDDLAEAVREAFSAAARRLEDYVRRRRGFVKTSAREQA